MKKLHMESNYTSQHGGKGILKKLSPMLESITGASIQQKSHLPKKQQSVDCLFLFPIGFSFACNSKTDNLPRPLLPHFFSWELQWIHSDDWMTKAKPVTVQSPAAALDINKTHIIMCQSIFLEFSSRWYQHFFAKRNNYSLKGDLSLETLNSRSPREICET